MTVERTPWLWLLAVVVRVYGLSPEDFWKLTTIELSYLLGAMHSPGVEAISRGDLNKLMNIYPDKR